METLGPGSGKKDFLSSQKGVLAAPDRFQGYARIASASRAAGEFISADVALRRARAISPADPRLLVNAVNLWLSTGVAGDSIRALHRALCLDPGFTPAADRLLMLLKALGDGDGALRIASRNVCGQPINNPSTRLELALLAFESGDCARARRLILATLPDMVRIGKDSRDLLRLGKRAGGSALLVQLARAFLCESPVSEVAARELASTPAENDTESATHAMLPRLSLARPMDTVVHIGAGVFQEGHDKPDQARRHYAKAMILTPELSVPIFNLGTRARRGGNFIEAARLFRRALVIGPDDGIYKYNLGHVLLATGASGQGLELYEERWNSGERQSHRRGGSTPSFPQPVWDGVESLGAEDSILIWGEQGVGDEIWFAGYVPRLFPDNRTVLECDGRLRDLFARSGLARTVVARVDPPHPDAAGAGRQFAAGSLPFLESRRSPIPSLQAPRGYLKVNRSRAEALRKRLAEISDGPTIGISWRSRKPNPNQSFEAPLRHWKPILDLPGATFVNLQYDLERNDLDEFHRRFGVRLVTFEDVDPLRDIDDLAALISVLDHVVSIANVNVPLCHGIGRGCHVALRFYQEDWRLQRDRTETPWLPDCQLYWPRHEGEWGPVFSRISDNLRLSVTNHPGGKLATERGL